MAERNDRERADRAQAMLVAVVLVATTLLWLGAQWVLAGSAVAPRWMFLIDFAALGAFVWAMIVTLRIRRQRRRS